ncbi:MAG: ABC transporter substrate-binding protein [Desulfovibrionaceae bacterium]|nr:ABC transporter substrate-binding protein [Desulfovibrionaceae bacterium]
MTVTDDAGRTITFDKPFTRIISLYAAHSENLFELGLDETIVGVTRNEDYPAKALAKTPFNARDGVERFLAAEPDLVLIRPMLDKGYPALWRRLENHGITVVSLQPNTIGEMYGYWRTLGKLTGRESQAEDMVRAFRDRIEFFEQRLEHLSEKDRPRVFFESIHAKFATFSPGSMPLFVLHYAGGRNVAPDAQPRHGTNIAYYGLERLLAKGRDIDVYLAQHGAMNKVSEKTIRNGPAASRIKAVLNNAVFLVDEHLVSRPTMRLLTGIETVYRLLHW